MYPSFSASSIRRITVQNLSSLARSNVIIPIPLPESIKESRMQISEGAEAEISLASYFFKSTNPILFTQIDLKPMEEKVLYLLQKTNHTTDILLNQSTQPGTEYLFVNYKRAIIVSTEQSNAVSFFSDDGKLLNTDQKPLILDKGKFFVLESITPKLIRLLSEKPIFVFESTLKEFKDVNSVEPGDSDTTSLYGSDLFFFTEKHLWISSYETTKVSIYDNNDIEVWSDTITSNSGIFKGDLKRGAYHIKSEKPVTIQFGYLDDENFSVVYGKNNNINGFSFGDLMITSLYPNTTISLEYGTEKINKKQIQFKQSGMTQIIHMIEKFEPQKPEFIFISLKFNNPIQVSTFSSGNNFGGEYICGKNGLFSDTEFSFVTLRVSKEYSKEQKNLIELIGLENDTNVTLTGSMEQKIELQAKTAHWIQSDTPLEKINFNSNKPFQVSQIHNFNTKGLFYWVPPLSDNSISLDVKDQNTAGMFQNETKMNQSLLFLFNRNRFKFFILNTKSIGNLPVTIFFLSIIILLLLFIILSWIQYFKKTKDQNDQNKLDSISSAADFNSIEEKPIEKLFSEPFVSIDDKKHTDITHQIEISNTVEKDLPTLSANPFQFTEEIKKSNIVIHKENTNLNISNSYQCTYLDHLKLNKVVLDPGSANRLYMEGKLSELVNAYIVKSSSKKITADVADKLNKSDLGLQDLSKGNVYKESLNTFEEAGKALALCKKLKINYYITSYKLPSMVQGIHVIHITDALKDN